MAVSILRAIGRGMLALLRVLLWEPLQEITRGASRGAGDFIRRLMPWALGAVAVVFTLEVAPELFQLVIMIAGLKMMIKGLLPAPKKKRKK